jgi:hypothetical protein
VGAFSFLSSGSQSLNLRFIKKKYADTSFIGAGACTS